MNLVLDGTTDQKTKAEIGMVVSGTRRVGGTLAARHVDGTAGAQQPSGPEAWRAVRLAPLPPPPGPAGEPRPALPAQVIRGNSIITIEALERL